MQREFWDAKFLRDGHTGYNDRLLYRYDQPLRLRAVRRLLRRLYPQGLAGLVILDAGFGTGDFIQLSLDLGAAEVSGFDLSQTVVESAKRRFTSRQNVLLEAGDAREIFLGEERFDLITCITVLQHIVEDDGAVDAMKNMARALRSGGRMVVLEISPTHGGKGTEEGEPIRVRTIARWKSLFARAGLIQVRSPQVYSPLGFCVLQLWLPGALNSALALLLTWRRGNMGHADETLLGRRLTNSAHLRRAYGVLRAAILAACFPVDYLFDVRVPEPLSYYHLFVLQRA